MYWINKSMKCSSTNFCTGLLLLDQRLKAGYKWLNIPSTNKTSTKLKAWIEVEICQSHRRFLDHWSKEWKEGRILLGFLHWEMQNILVKMTENHLQGLFQNWTRPADSTVNQHLYQSSHTLKTVFSQKPANQWLNRQNRKPVPVAAGLSSFDATTKLPNQSDFPSSENFFCNWNKKLQNTPHDITSSSSDSRHGRSQPKKIGDFINWEHQIHQSNQLSNVYTFWNSQTTGFRPLMPQTYIITYDHMIDMYLSHICCCKPLTFCTVMSRIEASFS